MSKVIGYLYTTEKRAMLALVLIALLSKTLVAFYVLYNYGTARWDDDHYYLYVGEQIASGNWSPEWNARTEIIVGPVLPLLIAFFKLVFGNPVVPFFFYNIVMGSLMVPVLYFLGREVFSRRVGWIMALWGLLYIEAFKYLPHLAKESTLFLFLPLTILLVIRSAGTGKLFRLTVLAALSYSWLIHSDERFIIYLPLLVGLFFIYNKSGNSPNATIKSLIWVGVVILTMIPWTVHNYRVHDQLVILTPRTTAFTSKLWGENLEKAASHFTDSNVRDAIIESRRERAEGFGMDHGKKPYEYGLWEARFKAFQHFWQPTYFRLHFIQYGFRTEMWSLRHNAASIIFYGIFLPFYLAGLALLIRRKAWPALLISLIPIIHSIMHAYMVWPLERYRSPITFIIVMVGVWAFLNFLVWCRLGGRDDNPFAIYEKGQH